MGNELADQIAKGAVRDKENIVTYNRIPKSTIYKELEDETTTKWQKACKESPKATLTKQFFPNISDIVKAKMNVTPSFSLLVTGHGKTRAYLHRFKNWKVQHVSASKKNKPRTI
jgi:primosomal protein N'